MHCDIKEGNLMIKEPDYRNPHVVIIDLGLSMAMLKPEQGVCGTPGYIPPETWRDGKWFPRGDVFSMGVVCMQVITNNVPNPKTGRMGIFQAGCTTTDDVIRITRVRKPPFEQLQGNLQNCNAVQKWLEPCLAKEMMRRPRVPQIKASPWFASGVPSAL